MLKKQMKNFDRLWNEMEDYITTACKPEDGHMITYEPVHWMRETTEHGDVIYRRMSRDEVEVMNANDGEGNK